MAFPNQQKPKPPPEYTFSKLSEHLMMCRHSPYEFVMMAFPWGVPGTPLEFETGPDTWQRELLISMGEELRRGRPLGTVIENAAVIIRKAIASGHGIGKSCFLAWIMLWAIATMVDTRVAVTANTMSQLEDSTWPELSKWFNLAVPMIQEMFEFTATAVFSRDPRHKANWRIDTKSWSENNPVAIQGLHNKGKRLVIIFDEASGIPAAIYEPIESGTLTDADTEIIWICFGNPNFPRGPFADLFVDEDWAPKHIDSRDCKTTNKDEIAKQVAKYGEDSDRIKVRVRGIFPSSSISQYIQASDLDVALKRQLKVGQYDFAARILTLDNAWTGDDNSVISLRQGNKFEVLKVIPYNEDDFLIGMLLANFEDEYKADAVRIDFGYGQGVYSYGKNNGREWMLVSFAGRSPDPGCRNLRAYLYQEVDQWIRNGGSLIGTDGKPDMILYHELQLIEQVPQTDGVLKIKSKEDMRKDAVKKKEKYKSPDRADSLALSFAYPPLGANRQQSETAIGRSLGMHVGNDLPPGFGRYT